ncbi:MAG: hypothetical protein IJ121_07790 [Eubacterium sp.]|nr:hypothetical protein [Eubacterium sp.]
MMKTVMRSKISSFLQRSFHKTIIFSLMLLACLLFLGTAKPTSAATTSFNVHLHPELNAVKISWPNKKAAVKYKIYRADVSDVEAGSDRIPERSSYKKVKTLKVKSPKGKRLSWSDKKAKNGRYYAYIVRAFDKNGKQVADSWDGSDWISYACKGLGRTWIGNDGYGENYINSRKELHISVMSDQVGIDVSNAQVILYRKNAGAKKFKKIATRNLKNGSLDYTDKNVKAGKKYSYRARVIKKAGGKTYKAKMSKTITIPAVNFHAKYKVKCLTPAGTYTDRDKLEITMLLQNKGKYNGMTTILKQSGEYFEAEYSGEKKGVGSGRYSFRFTMYSKDNVTWKPIPAKGIKLPKKKPLYLKGEILKGEEPAIYFGGSAAGWTSFIDSEGGMFDYEGPGAGYTSAMLSFSTGTGGAYMEWD